MLLLVKQQMNNYFILLATPFINLFSIIQEARTCTQQTIYYTKPDTKENYEMARHRHRIQIYVFLIKDILRLCITNLPRTPILSITRSGCGTHCHPNT